MLNALTRADVQIALVLVAIAAIVGVWMRMRQRKQAVAEAKAQIVASPVAASPGKDLAILLRQLLRQLALAKANNSVDSSSLRDLPVILVLGPSQAGKTSVVTESQLRPEPQASQSCGAHSEPAETWKVWLAERTVFLEIPESAAANADCMKLLARQLRPGFFSLLRRQTQAARSILFCVDQSSLSLQMEAQVSELGRTWNSRLKVLSDALGAQVPVYALCTKMDKVEGFSEFVEVLAREEAAQPVGATLAAYDPGSRQAYAEWADQMVPKSFSEIVCSLRDSRVAVMSRTRDSKKLARQYEFSKRFERFQNNLLVFLRELTMTSQVQIEPFLRGYYFCGTRSMTIDGEQEEPTTMPEGDEDEGMVTATTVFDPKKHKAGLAAGGGQVRQQHEVTEWLFLPAFFRGVLLADQTAQKISGRSWRTDLARSWAIGAAGVAALLFVAALTTSYARNRALERELIHGAGVVAGKTPTEPLARLEALRPGVDRIIAAYKDAPWSMRWGLNQASNLMPPAQSIYCTAMREQVLDGLRKRIEARLGSVKTTGCNSSEDIQVLKAYMMMTTHPSKAEEGFLSNVLTAQALKSGEINANRSALLEGNLRTFASLLTIPDAQHACVFAPPAGLIPSAQAYLRGGARDHYQDLLQRAGNGLEPVNYNTRYPNDAVKDSHVVPGWFTRQGWDQMQSLLRHPGESLKADAWVLDQADDAQPGELKALAEQLGTRYRGDYVREWKAYLTAAQVTPYASLNDAAAKLETMSGQRSALLRVIGVAFEHTVALEPLKQEFQPVGIVVAANGEFQATKYLEGLDALKNRLGKADKSTGPARDQDAQEVRGAATAAQDAVDQIARGFKGETDQLVKSILLRPITQIDGLLTQQNSQALNGAGKDFCREVEAVTRAFPFARSVEAAALDLDSVQRMLKPGDGAMWRFYDKSLQDSLTCTDSGCFVKENPKYPVSKAFERYFNSLNQWSHLLFGPGGEAVVRLQIQAAKHNNLQKLDVAVDGTVISMTAGSPARSTLTWDLRKSGRLQLMGVFEGESAPQDLFLLEGPWALFEWLARDPAPNSGGTEGFRWIPTQGRVTARKLKNNNTMEYKLMVSWGPGGGRPLDWRSLTPGPCVLPLAR